MSVILLNIFYIQLVMSLESVGKLRKHEHEHIEEY